VLSFHVILTQHPRRPLDSSHCLPPTPCALSPKSFTCHTSAKSPVSLSIATLPKTRVSKPRVCHTCETPRGECHKLLTKFPRRKFVLRSIATKDLFSSLRKARRLRLIGDHEVPFARNFHPEEFRGLGIPVLQITAHVQGRSLNPLFPIP